jgi:hypothetical protein
MYKVTVVYHIKLPIHGIFVNEISAMKKGIVCFVKGITQGAL